MSRWPRAVPDANAQPMTPEIEQELRAMRICHAELDGMTPEAKLRVLLWLGTVNHLEVTTTEIP